MKMNPLNAFRCDDISWNCLGSVSRGRSDDLFYKHNHNLSNDANGSFESSDLFFFSKRK